MVGVQDIGGVTTVSASSISGEPPPECRQDAQCPQGVMRNASSRRGEKTFAVKKKTQNLIDADSALNHVSESSEQVTGFLLPRKPSSNFG
jgi:hypothetical protein